MSNASDEQETGSGRAHTAGAFDIRTVIGGLLGVYGVILTLTGIFAGSTAGVPDPDDYNSNLITGLVMIAAGVIFLLWARLRPVVVPADVHEGESDPSQ